jgi:NAD+ diphosphatase
MPFKVLFKPSPEHTGKDLWFIFRDGKLLVRTTGTVADIPISDDIEMLKSRIVISKYLGSFDDISCYAADIDDQAPDVDGMTFTELRPLLSLLDEDLFAVAGRASHILHWDRTHQFCGRCGNRTEPETGELARNCPQCRLLIYPGISPAIIVAIIRGKEILLAQSHRYKTPFYSVLAGFVEPGETFEETVSREVREEAGIEVRNIKYFGSQPWPFPNTLMVGFTAEYESGEIVIDESEIVDAGWFSADNLPNIPRPGSISRRLIDYFISKSK